MHWLKRWITTALSLAATGGLIVAGVAGCQNPVEPGSDLPDSSPPAQLGPEIDVGLLGDVKAEEGADISGKFDLEATLSSPLGGGRIPLVFVARFEQMGEVTAGGATVSVELRSPQAPDMPGPSTEMPAAISEDGSFEAEITGLTIPAGASEMLKSDTDADVTLDAQIVDSDCVQGDTTVTMKDVEVPGSPNPIPSVDIQGPFTAARQGTAGCGGGGSGQGDAGMSEVGMDADGVDADGVDADGVDADGMDGLKDTGVADGM